MNSEQKLDTTDPEFKTWVRGLLHDENTTNLRITFTKADGAERSIHGTLAPSRIPADKTPKGTGSPASDDACRLFDVDIQEWRSFRWDRVKTVEFSIGDNE